MSDLHTSRGSCHCGAIEFEVKHDSNGTLCQCRTCQIISSDRSFNLSVKIDNLKVTKGNPTTYDDTSTDSGKPAIRSFCGTCGTALWTKTAVVPDVLFVKVGPLHDAEQVKLAANIYVESTIPGAEDKNCKHFEGMAKKQVDV
ncbi:hypothetical protein OIV83_005775 [Microbotryomycetes sp. JL201]|nr:hypothetical protein OIV83_005775 [Microbotryomycetes sp. JL201]